jgi:DNA-binding beta-propeller fold protein YncE
MRTRTASLGATAALALAVATPVWADSYRFSVVARNLDRPVGIAVEGSETVYFTEVPDPGVGGGNGVSSLELDTGVVTQLNSGEPEPTDVAVARNGDLYWTCKTAGVILRRSYGKVSVFRDNLNHPSGIAIDHEGETLYFTEVPTPGVAGDQGGKNRVRAIDLRTGALRTIHPGDPEPTDVAVARNGNLYWTCTSAGVIIEAKRRRGRDGHH